ncbi:MAG TPA: VOC family protein [Candidatus Eisenbacteria bacterium]|nr:VOC family protein [Candidatus Eisenbacteria bacterium]
MGKLRHVAFISREPKKLSDFYRKHFGFEECKVFPSGSRMVIDPLFNLAFLQSRGDQAGPAIGTHRADGAELEREPGIHHYGFIVDDLERAVAKLPPTLKRGKSPQVSAGVGGPEGARPAEVRFIDPWGNNVDLSSRGFLGREERRLPGVRLVVVQLADPDRACDFYRDQFDLELVGGDADGAVRLSDGTVTLLLTKAQIRPKSGIQYFGIQVADLSALKKRLQDDGVVVFEDRASELGFADPEGNRVVLSERGWAN